MKIKKMVSAMTSGILAAIISVSAVPLTASAEPEKGKLTVSLLDFNISDEPVYPSTVRGDELYDFELVLKSGTKYKGTQSGSEVVFDNVTPDFEGAKITYKTDRSKVDIPEDVNISWSVYDTIKKQWSASEVTIDPFYVAKEMTEDYKNKLSQVKNRDELETLTPEYTGNYLYAIQPSTKPSGFGSVMLAEMPYATNERLDNSVFIADRDTYRMKEVINTSMTVGDTSVPCYYDPLTGILYFSFPDKCSGEIKITVSGFYDGTDAIYTTEFILDGDPIGGYYSADNFVFVAGIDSEYSFDSTDITDNQEDHTGEDDPGEQPENPSPLIPDEPDNENTRSQINFSLTSKLDKYDTSLVANLNTWFNVCNASDKDKTLLADNPSSFGGFDLKQNATASIKLGNGNYVPSYSELLTVTGAKPFSVKNTGSAEYKLVADAKYSLEIKGTGNLDYSINAVDYKTSSGYKFLIEPNVDYVLIDNVSGNMYKATATDKNPKLVIDLTSKTGMIDNINNPTGTTGNPDYEDVPNTSDNILLFILLPLIAVVPLSIIGVLMFKKNRKAGMHND